ncbi:hypothetical protein [Brachyspira hyodysenteriae]|uniref:hypothetical protein n=1 Tax=Brachyspira hyodysenteriae TaxID=159 RepID=UPI00063DA26B|nr:hypothetical protein [Brachyspira hyodysenteriae]KLI34037.1 hypothetical protein SZ48_07025 [Brachyspira hyodysenteriae]TVL41883.1 hypothetical protein A9X73_04410 [Brachyspira hyodysenteriae]TVL66770.1 hypothetical protein A9X85_05415 [Brachyspira hyodysenteriae]TVL74969.1 hypothetical protein A9X79_00370 [Brachyspira hyodysenteriae]WPC25390.1 hypothetical protein N4239_06170 [Brachyspira hyodysenteriae]
MKNIFKITLIILVILSSTLLAQWEVNIDNDLMFIMNFDKENESVFSIGIDTSIADDILSVYGDSQIAVVLFYSDKIIPNNNLYLRIKKKSNNYITYSISDDDIIETDESIYIGIGIKTENGIRANNLINILLDSSELELYSNDELLGYFNLKDLKDVLKENIGNTEWYNKKIKD